MRRLIFAKEFSQDYFDTQFPPFYQKQLVELAPTNRFYRVLAISDFENAIKDQNSNVLNEGIAFFKERKRKPAIQKWKFLHFQENFRPGYFGKMLIGLITIMSK